MIKKHLLALAIAAAPLIASPALQADEEVNINAIPVTDNIYMLSGKGGNIGLLLGVDGSFIIDAQYAPLTEKILSTIRSIGGETPQYLFNTHFHGDHTGGNENMGNQGSTIVAHDKVRERLVNGYSIKTFGMKSGPAHKVALPSITFAERMRFETNGETVSAVHVPSAHTDGDSYVHFKNANVVHAGDIFFNGFYPFIDAPNGGSVRGMIQAVDEILAITDANSKIIPGHGPLADRKQLQAYRDMLATAYSRLLKLKNEGVSAEDAVMEGPLDDLEATWGGGLFSGERWIGIVYPAIY